MDNTNKNSIPLEVRISEVRLYLVFTKILKQNRVSQIIETGQSATLRFKRIIFQTYKVKKKNSRPLQAEPVSDDNAINKPKF